jgi:hypothetical protein
MRQKTGLLKLLALCAILCLLTVAPAHALVPLPDIGIDYRTMRVIDANKLAAAGMKDARNGDGISMRISRATREIIFKNKRTGEELVSSTTK